MNRTLGSLATGSIVNAEVGGQSRRFLVVQQGRPSSMYSTTFDGVTVLLMEGIYSQVGWNNSESNSYQDSTVHRYLNGDFLVTCSSMIQSHVKQVKIPFRAGSGIATTVTSGENGLSAKIWLPSCAEMGMSSESYALEDGVKFAYFTAGFSTEANSKRIAYFNSAPVYWWLRSPYCSPNYGGKNAWACNDRGYMNGTPCTSAFGLRPALALPNTLYVTDTGELTEDNGLVGVYVKRAGAWVKAQKILVGRASTGGAELCL